MTLRLIDTFSGIGGFSYAAEKLVGGFKTVAFVECEPYCQKVLKKHWPDVPIYEDIKTYQPEPYSASVICGGFPCQSISNCGHREGITETSQSGLWYELYRVICLLQPRYVVLENVSAILSRGLGIVLGNLASAGYCCEYACIPATFIKGACHQRDRWWLVAYSTSVSDGSQIEIQARGNTFIRSSTTNTEGSEGNGNETIEKYGKVRTQEIFRDRNGGKNTYTWRNTPHELKGDWREWSIKPVICRNPDGVPSGVDRAKRLKSLGNSIVPQVAAIPLQRVLDLEKLTVSN
jgi:DNA (cytosine-5)-methyltransferase 1